MNQIKRTLSVLAKNIMGYKYTILTLVYFCIIILYPIGFKPKLLPLVGCLSVFFILNIISKSRLSYLYAILLIVLVAFNARVSFAYSSYISPSIIAAIVETNSVEVQSTAGKMVIPSLILLILTSLLIILSLRELKTKSLSVKKSLLILSLFVLLLSSISFRRILLITDMREEYNEAPIATFATALNYYTPFFYGNLMIVTSYLYDLHLFKEYIKTDRMIPEGIATKPDGEKVEKIFLVIGESANLKYMSLFGYEVPTTPFLDSLNIHTEEVFCYPGRGIASQTRTAVPGILSSNTAKNMRLFRKEMSIVDLAKNSGYTTYWFSNQWTGGLWNGRDAIGVIAARSDYVKFPGGIGLADDFTILSEVEKYYESGGNKQLFVIHLQGSHFLYKDRYDEEDEMLLPGEDTLLKQYERSIHHTDRFLKKLYKYVEQNESSVLLYVSDHGQEIKEMFGHGVGKPTKNQFYIPVVAINKSSAPIDSIAMKYVDPNDSIISNNCILPLTSELMGYEIAANKIKKTIEDGRFVLHGDDYVYKYSNLE